MIWLERWRALRHHRLQSVLAIAALSTAIALPVVLLSVGGGVAAHEIAALENSGFQVTVSAPGAHGISEAHTLSQKIGAVADVAAASPVLSAAIDAFPSASVTTPLLAEGIIPGSFAATESPEFRGLLPQPLPFSDPTDLLRFHQGAYDGPPSSEVMVSTPFASDYGLQVGDTLRLGQTADAGGSVPFQIVGMFGIPPAALGPTAAFGVLMPLSDLQLLTGVAVGVGGGTIDAADTIEVALVAGASTDPSAIQRVASAISALAPYYGVSALTDEAAQIRASAAVLSGFSLALSSVGLLVGLVFLALVLLRRVESERRTIGIERALGVPATQVAAEWLRRSVTLGAIGAAGGLLAGGLVVTLLARFGAGAAATAAQLAVFDAGELSRLAVAIVALAAITGLIATRAALRVPITEALR